MKAVARRMAAISVAYLMLGLAIVGHVVVLLAGAVDALISARVGTRRLGYVSRQLSDVIRDTWKDNR